ncbi:MAG: S10 family peptidase [Rhodospirillales bacterium]
MRFRSSALAWAFAVSLAAGAAPFAAAQDAAPRAAPPGAIEEVAKAGTLTAYGRAIAYTATAGTLPVVNDAGVPQANVFYVAYDRDGGPRAARPITFVFNGGPGAASAYLHLGALGPRRIVFGDDGTIPPSPPRLIDNAETWLDFTDLVFVDPVGTGFSVAPKREEKEGEGARFWGVNEDIDAIAAFIRLYLTRKDRWGSPKFLAGESYGGFRVARLASHLPTHTGIELNGVIMISPVLEFSLHDGDDYRAEPWVLRIPSYAATARHLNVVRFGNDAPLATALREVEAFSVGALLPGMARGDTMPPAEQEALLARLAGYIGLPPDYVQRSGGRIQRTDFAGRLLRDSRRIVSLYDGAIVSIDPDPGDRGGGGDGYLSAITAAFAAAAHRHLRDELGVKTDVPYRVLAGDVNQGWNWRSGRGGRQGYVGSAGSLKLALSRNLRLKAMIAHGYFDLVTPYFASHYVVAQMSLDPAARRNVQLADYPGGHMFYTHAASRVDFTRDVRALYAAATAE